MMSLSKWSAKPEERNVMSAVVKESYIHGMAYKARSQRLGVRKSPEGEEIAQQLENDHKRAQLREQTL